MSKTEDLFESFLNENKIQYIKYFKIYNIPFNNRKYHLVDFYLPEKDLYVEVKGFMTLFQINILTYLSEYTDKYFYILQMTEEDWIEPYDRQKHISINRKIQNNISIQFEEILNMKNNELWELSKHRLKEYIKYRKHDIDRWKINENI